MEGEPLPKVFYKRRAQDLAPDIVKILLGINEAKETNDVSFFTFTGNFEKYSSKSA